MTDCTSASGFEDDAGEQLEAATTNASKTRMVRMGFGFASCSNVRNGWKADIAKRYGFAHPVAKLRQLAESTMRVAMSVRALALGSLIVCSGAQACSVPGSYRVPSTLQLVEDSDAIVLARIVDGGPAAYEPLARMGGRSARLVPFAAIKGQYAGLRISFEDAALELQSAELRATPSDPRNLVDANPDTFAGSCNRYVFKPGMIVVAFLKRDRKDFAPYAPAFSRALEDVPNENALWVKAVRMYAAIAEKPRASRRKEMQRQRDILSFQLDDPDARLLALELDRALRDVVR